MAERPIIFCGEMVRAILDGRKTQTRRIIKRPARLDARYYPLRAAGRYWWGYEGFSTGLELVSPYGYPLASRLWVRETWAVAPIAIHYRADNGFVSFPDEPRLFEYASTKGWRPSIHMPRWASRLTLRVTDVRVQRVQDISEEDAIAEGVERVGDRYKGYMQVFGEDYCPATAKTAFSQLWEVLNAKRGYGWDANPWVWAISFERVAQC